MESTDAISEAPPGFALTVLQWALSWAIAVPWLTIACVTALFTRDRAHRMLSAWARLQLRIWSVRVEVADLTGGVHRQRACVFGLLNQTSLIEFLLWLSLPVRLRIVVNVEFALLPWAGWASALSAGIVVVRQWRAQRRRAVARAARTLREGRHVGISLEGERSPDGRLGPYKRGAAALAQAAGAPVVPIWVRGAADRLPFRAWRIRPGAVRVALHPPVLIEGSGRDAQDRLLAKLRAIAEAEQELSR